MVVIGKLTDVRHTANMAGRYAAWERTVWYDAGSTRFAQLNAPNRKSDSEIGNEIAVRILNDRSRTTTVIKQNDRNASTFANGIDPMWRDNANVAYLDRYEQLGSTITNSRPTNDIAGRAVGLLEAVSIPAVVSVVPPLPTDTLAIANVRFGEIGKRSTAYQRLWPRDSVWREQWNGLNFTGKGAILSNTWGANGSSSTTAMVQEAVPMAKGLGNYAGNAAVLSMRAWNLNGPSADFGKVAPDVVPADRLR